ncbi:coagulation factor IXb [Kryptolebias marmoratus]|uniref:Coagulation factor IX n=1 Tax=Kryptolebias marmoratus TaxID=37003 RepID=A0A3Q3A399_KRYMA|nr:coagulation factor IXb [Kryptolebias marmoratus]
MARVCLLIFISCFQLQIYGLGAEIQEENTGAVFVTQQAAHTVLNRQRRHNNGHLEEIFFKANLERECKEEVCSMEEAREVFENDEKTMEFWAVHVDGDQCRPEPCQNGGVCQDGINSYTCWCRPNFSGKNCETDITKLCSVNNGGCSHFCMMERQRAVCQCATGYKLGTDRKTCESIVEFSCGLVVLPAGTNTRSITPVQSSFESSTQTRQNDTSDHPDDYNYLTNDYDTNTNDNLNLTVNVSDLPEVGSKKLGSSPNVSLAEAAAGGAEPDPMETFSWGFTKLPNIMAETNSDQRIVGGDEAIPGEIPWQVVLMFHSESLNRALPFCGGSLISDVWVITAAHCLENPDGTKKDFFVRVGEHDVNVHEGPERDHAVAEKHTYLYNSLTSKYNHDIALLKLASPVELSNQRRPICLGPKDFIQNLLRGSTNSLVSGWGRLLFQGPEATKLQKLSVPHVDRTLCKHSSRDHITRYMFCAGYPDGQKDSCQGDSGGPLATSYKGTWFLTGIVSWGEECARKGKYGIYTRVSRYYKWIGNTTGIVEIK